MNVLVTGSEGFIGSHVTDRLMDDPEVDEVYRVDKLEPRVHGHDRPPIESNANLWTWEVGNTPYTVLREIDVLVHLAAQVSVADSMNDPHRYIAENSLQTATLLQELREIGRISKIVVASSMSVYGPGGKNVSEDAPVQPESIYGLTKYDQERLALMYGEMMEIPAVALRYFNVYGRGQALDNPYTGVIANFARRLLNNEPPIVFEDGQQTRDFVHVSDVADATHKAATSDIASGAYNVCTGDATTIEEMAKLLARGLGKDIEPEITGRYRDGDVRHCTGDPRKLYEELGFVPTVSVRTGIDDYTDWLQETRG